MVMTSLAALVAGGAFGVASAQPAVAPIVNDPNRDQGWQGLPDVDQTTPRRSRAGRPQPVDAEPDDLAPVQRATPRSPRSDAEAAGLRLGSPSTPPTTEERERRAAEGRRAPWVNQSRQSPALGPSGLVPPNANERNRPLSSRAEPLPNRRTGRLAPRATDQPNAARPRAGEARTANRAPLGLRPTFQTVRTRQVQEVTLSAVDRRALLQAGGRGVAPPVQPPRGADVPTIVERGAPGRVLPNANPLGPAAVIDPRTGEVVSFARTVPPVNLRPSELVTIPAPVSTQVDPFAPVGLRLGSFLVLPSVDATLGYDTNPTRAASRTATGGAPATPIRGSAFSQVTGDIIAISDWSRHEVAARLRGSYTSFFDATDVNRPDLAATVTGRLDISRESRLFAEGRYVLGATSAGSANLPSLTGGARLTGLPLTHQFGATLAGEQDLGRLRLTLRGSLDRFTFDDAPVSSGPAIDQSSRNYNAAGLRLRTAYELTPGLRPFVEVGVERRTFDTPVTLAGAQQGSTALTARAGASFEITRLITGEVSGGVIQRRNADPRFGSVNAPVIDGSLVWTPSALTTVTLTARSTIDETTIVNSSGIERRDFGLQVEHGFRRWLTGTARLGVGFDRYDGTTRRDTRMLASLGLVYRANRNLQIRGEIRHERLQSSQPGTDFTANVMLVGLRLQR